MVISMTVLMTVLETSRKHLEEAESDSEDDRKQAVEMKLSTFLAAIFISNNTYPYSR